MHVVKPSYSPEVTTVPDLDQLFAAYYDRLVFFAWQIVKDKQQAQDTAQDAFVAYWQQRHEIADHPAAVKNFLYRSVKNASLNIVRHSKVVDQHASAQTGTEPSEAYIIEAIISSELIAEVHQAINSLPEHLRKVSRLSFLEGKKNHEVADELDMSVNTVKKQKQRAMELLKVKLRPDAFIVLLSLGAVFIEK